MAGHAPSNSDQMMPANITATNSADASVVFLNSRSARYERLSRAELSRRGTSSFTARSTMEMLGWNGPGKQDSGTVSEHGTAARHIRESLRFCEGPSVRFRDAPDRTASSPQLPLQPWTWLQLATIFCFTGSGKATKSSSAAIWSPFLNAHWKNFSASA